MADIIKSAALVLSEIKETYKKRGETKSYKKGIMGDKSPFNTTLQMAQLILLVEVRDKLDKLIKLI